MNVVISYTENVKLSNCSHLFFQTKFEQRKEFPGLAMMFLAVEGKFLMLETIREGKLNYSFTRYLVLKNVSALFFIFAL